MTEVMIFGAGGQLGRELVRIFPESARIYHASNTGGIAVDLSDLGDVSRIIMELKPKIVINAAALANVDLCEKDHPLAYAVNGEAVGAMASASRKIGAKLVHVSTDYVFDGNLGNYRESATPNPINYYGLSKLVGDIYALSYEHSMVIRTSGVFGYTRNFPLFVLEKLNKGEQVNAMEGYYSPIHAANLAASISALTKNDFSGLINIAGDRVSRYDLALRIARTFETDASLVHETKNIANMNARRPFDSSLDSSLAISILGFDFHSLASNLKAMKDTMDKQEKGN